MALRDLCEQYNISFKKQLGQNLLLDENINRIMVDAAAVTLEDDVIEVGAGLGALTGRLAERARRVLAIEIDRSFMPCLEDQFGGNERVRLFRGDVLNHDVEKLVEEFLPGAQTLKMVSNLPYYITTPVLFHFWESTLPFERMVVMMQEEVALRMVDPVNGPDYGVLALAASLFSEVDIVHKVPRTCFRPQPRVDSCIVRMRRHEDRYPGLQAKFLMRIIRSAFAQRRKTLRNSLTKSGTFGVPRDVVLAAFESTGIDPGRRPQTMSLDEFAALAREIRKGI
ncbi:MAG: ribosomal RNA small subunit methyltransferase A [Candidatus Hydrogenedentes bacterium]|nr:ribosomal RNA small subunit methyltransferase A [Candidatus Hydrogenedentota bacterium]